MDTLLVLSDLHVNSTVALCKPSVQLDDGGTYHLSQSQRQIWRSWNEMIEQVEAARKGRLVTIFNGDLAEGDAKDRSFQVISHNPATILQHVADVVDPIARLSDKLYVVRGTMAHTGKSNWYEEHLGLDLEAEQETYTEAHSWYHLKLDVDGVRCDIAHETRMGGKRASRTTAATRYAFDLLEEYDERDERPPHLAIRSHVHRWGDSYDACRIRAIYTPGWSATTEYINSKNPGALGQWGALLVFCEGGQYEVSKIKFKEPKKLWVKA